LNDVVAVRQLETTNSVLSPTTATHWELELRDHADPQAILQTCFARGIRLRSFNQSEPTLHEVFMHLVGPEAREAAFR
jgi:ABC-2 type transport system ATP-binding protein